MKLERLQKVMAHAGVASRRASEAIIEQGRVTVNGKVVTQMGVKVDPQRDTIAVDGEPLIKNSEKSVYIMLNKPLDVLSAAQDDRGRATVVDLVDVPQRVYPVGRLDLRSQGLILMTNDGELAETLTHPRYEVDKEYHVWVTGQVSWETLKKWRTGQVELDGPPLKPAEVEVVEEKTTHTLLKVVLTEGRKRQIRLVAQALGHHVKRLERVRLGPLRLGRLKTGHWRHLKPAEVQQLKKLIADKQ